MNVSQENNGLQTAIIHIKLVEDDYIAGVNKQLSEYRKKAKMPGFRPGMVPMGIVKKMYGKGVLAEEVNKTISEALNKYIVENKVNVLGYPLPNMEKTTTVDFDTQKEFDFYFDIGLAPEFELEVNDQFSIPWYDIKVDEKEIEKAINDIKVRYGTEENPETAELKDGLQGVFSELDSEGQIVEGGVTHHAFFRIEDIGPKNIQEQFIGAKAETAVDFNLMEAFNKDEDKVASLLHLHDKSEEKLNANYKFVVEKVVRSKEAELGEELYKQVYPNDEIPDEEAFRARLTEDLKKHHNQEAERQMLADAINKLIATTDLQLPDDFMKRWLVESNDGKITAQQVEEQYDSYKKSMRWQLIEGKLMETFGEELQVTNEEVRDKIRAYFLGSGVKESNPQIEGIVDNILQNQEERQRLYSGILDEKYIRIFKEKMNLETEEVDIEKFYEIVSKNNEL